MTAKAVAGRKSSHLEDAFQVGVVGGKAMVRRCTPAEEECHGVALIPEGGLHPDEHIAKLPAIDEQVLALRVQLACTQSRRDHGSFTTHLPCPENDVVTMYV